MTSLIISVCGIHSHPTTEANPLRQPLPSAILAWNELDMLESVEPNWFSAAYLLSYAFPCSISSLFSSLSLCPAPWLALFGHVKLTSSPTPCTDELQVRLVHRRRARASLRCLFVGGGEGGEARFLLLRRYTVVFRAAGRVRASERLNIGGKTLHGPLPSSRNESSNEEEIARRRWWW